MINDKLIQGIYNQVEGEFYLFDLDAFRSNIQQLTMAFATRVPNFQLAYSYKTNYTPAICMAAHEEGALAEVVSSFEYELAIANGLNSYQIIVNGPVHGREFLQRVLMEGAQLNVDGFYMLNLVNKVCFEFPQKEFNVGLRFNFQIDDGPVSRFGFYKNTENLERIKQIVNSTSNLSITALHCHFSTALRSEQSFASRAARLISIFMENFVDQPVQQINIGGGFFSKMPKSLQEQFGVSIPDYDDYAEAICNAVHESMPDSHELEIVIEPGTALVADIGYFICPVLDVKTIASRNIALVSGSVHNIKPTMNPKNLPIRVINKEKPKTEEKLFDLVGYTCMETDYLCKEVRVNLCDGDLIMFQNVGGYTNVFKPPFIRLQAPIYVIESGHSRLAKRKEKQKMSLEHMFTISAGKFIPR